jgi:hypothetical protein
VGRRQPLTQINEETLVAITAPTAVMAADPSPGVRVQDRPDDTGISRLTDEELVRHLYGLGGEEAADTMTRALLCGSFPLLVLGPV